MSLLDELKVASEVVEKEITDLAIKAIEASETYDESSRRVRELLCKTHGPYKEFLVDETCKKIKEIAMQKKTAEYAVLTKLFKEKN